MIKMKNILILSPHTDDAEIGCGGSIVRLIEENIKILWVVFSTAEESLPKNLPKNTLVLEFKNVIKNLKLTEENFKIFNYRVRHLHEHRQEILEELVRTKNEFHPDLVIGPSLNDFHQDHVVVATEMVRAFKTASSIICYELPWNHVTFNTQMFIKLKKEHIVRKINILSNYKSQILKNRQYFSEDFVKGLASIRGCQIRADYAEAFEVVRWII